MGKTGRDGFQPEVAKDSFTLAQRLLASYDVKWHKDKRLASQTNPNQLTIDPNTMLVVDEAVLANSYELINTGSGSLTVNV